jgi:hypothetical protein
VASRIRRCQQEGATGIEAAGAGREPVTGRLPVELKPNEAVGQVGPWLDRPLQVDPESPVDVSPWDALLKSDLDFIQGTSFMTQICLPIEEAPRLLRLLSFVGVDAAALIPGYDGVVAALQERRYWESGEEFWARERRQPILENRLDLGANDRPDRPAQEVSSHNGGET